MSDTEMIKRIVQAQYGDGGQYRPNPKGRYPVCVPALWSKHCERCGRLASENSGPCPAVPSEQRWGDDWEGEPSTGKAVQAVLEAVGAFYGVPVEKVSAELVEGFVRDVETRAKVAAAGEIKEGG